MTAAGTAQLGVAWRIGNPEEAGKVLAGAAISIDAAWVAAPGDTASFELVRSAQRLIDGMKTDLGDPALDSGHAAEGAATLWAMLLGAKAVPDAVSQAVTHIDEALLRVGELWQHIGYQPPFTQQLGNSDEAAARVR